MIVEIEKPRPSCISSLNYNEHKVDREVAQLVAKSNVPSSERAALYSLFSSREKTRYPVREVSFHASVNPSEEDACSEEEILDFISSLMDHLSLGNQPYLVYRHSDIGRMHYHIVSVRVDGNGRKINNFYEKQRALAYIASVAEKYRFSVPERGRHVRTRESVEERECIPRREVFHKEGGDLTKQIYDIFSFAMSYSFESMTQLCCILEDLGLRAEETMGDDSPVFVFQGLDAKGIPCTKPIFEQTVGEGLYEKGLIACTKSRQQRSRHTKEKERLGSLLHSAFNYSKSRKHFENILRNKGIAVHYCRTEEGEIFGITIVDHRMRCAFKASEIPSSITVAMMQEAVENGHWRAQDRGEKNSESFRRERRSGKMRIRRRAVSAALQSVGQPRGNSWSGKSAKSENERREEADLKRSGALDASFVDHSLE